MDNTLHQYQSSAELKAAAKEHLFGKYGIVVSAVVIVIVITELVSAFCTALLNLDTVLGIIFHYIISCGLFVLFGLFLSGIAYFSLKLSCDRTVAANDIFYGFQMFPGKALLIQLYLAVWICIAAIPISFLSYFLRQETPNAVLILISSLLSIIGGVVIVMVFLIYLPTFFLLHDFPDYSVTELLSLSRKLMNGSKCRFFYLLASFIPLMLLGSLSFGIAYLWLFPYICTTIAGFFLDLIKKSS
ncbi:MAG: DUF975 family protein [Clostridium sp.]|nr:DUF975 family protein [Clostridium sp.]